MTLTKQTLITTTTPLPSTVSRSTALAFLHDHPSMIRLNPLVLRLQRTTPPPTASADEFSSPWYEITDSISYLPGGLYKGEVTYKACFHDLPDGLQTHTFAPAGLELRGKWIVGGNEKGEPREKLELGMEVPREGLYVREDVDMRCNVFLTGFVRKNLEKSHKVVVDKLVELGERGQHGGEGDYTGRSEDYERSGYGEGDHRQHNSTSLSPPAPAQGSQPLTPVDSNTVEGPDSYLTQHSAASYTESETLYSKEDASEPGLHRGHHPDGGFHRSAHVGLSSPTTEFEDSSRLPLSRSVLPKPFYPESDDNGDGYDDEDLRPTSTSDTRRRHGHSSSQAPQLPPLDFGKSEPTRWLGSPN